MILALLLVPAAAGMIAFVLRWCGLRRALLVGAALAHSGLVVACWCGPVASRGTSPVAVEQRSSSGVGAGVERNERAATPDVEQRSGASRTADATGHRPKGERLTASGARSLLGGWVALDAPGLLFLTIASLLFLAGSMYAVGYLSREPRGAREDFEEGLVFSNAPEAVFTGCLLLFLSAMTLVTVSRHVGVLWVAIEATTLASAPLIYFHRHRRSLEATWKYLLICSVGIALALLGNFFLAVAAAGCGGSSSSGGVNGAGSTAPLTLDALVARAASLDAAWLKAAFLFLLVGYGTKMGLAPLHTWLPDAHSESPSVVSALLSGALLNCAFLGILRALEVCAAAGLAEFGQELLVGFGLVSMGVAAAFMVRQGDYKRMLAYSSVEHMGILALGMGLGGAGVFGAMLHAVNHSLAKAMLFLVAGNILAAYRSHDVWSVSGVLRVLPASGVLWLAGFLAITGSPPFGTFLSELTILKAALDGGRAPVAVAYLVFLSLAFVGMASCVLKMAQGPAPTCPDDLDVDRAGRGGASRRRREPVLAIVPAALLASAVLALGLYVPPFLGDALDQAAVVVSPDSSARDLRTAGCREPSGTGSTIGGHRPFPVSRPGFVRCPSRELRAGAAAPTIGRRPATAAIGEPNAYAVVAKLRGR